MAPSGKLREPRASPHMPEGHRYAYKSQELIGLAGSNIFKRDELMKKRGIDRHTASAYHIALKNKQS